MQHVWIVNGTILLSTYEYARVTSLYQVLFTFSQNCDMMDIFQYPGVSESIKHLFSFSVTNIFLNWSNCSLKTTCLPAVVLT